MRLDGGAMFGNAPRALWQRWVTPDGRNMIDIGSRALLIRTGSENILFETGVGAYLSPEMKKRFQIVEDHHVLLNSLKDIGLTHEQITCIILSHLHFDHAGGLLKKWQADNKGIELLFPNAAIFVGKENFLRSSEPHLRDRAAFIPGLSDLLGKSGRLHFIKDKDHLSFGPVKIEFVKSHGHTPGMMMSFIKTDGIKILFASDMAPGHVWVNLSITMGYDRFPEKLIEEKQKIFQKVLDEKAWIFYTHDVLYAASKLSFDKEKKRFIPIDFIQDLENI